MNPSNPDEYIEFGKSREPLGTVWEFSQMFGEGDDPEESNNERMSISLRLLLLILIYQRHQLIIGFHHCLLTQVANIWQSAIIVVKL